MLHELRELEARVLKLDRTIQSLSLAKTLLPHIHNPRGGTPAEIQSANKTLDNLERRVTQLAEMMHRLTRPLSLWEHPHGKLQSLGQANCAKLGPIRVT